MANKCGVCGRFTSAMDGVKCSNCLNMFHRQCVNLKNDARKLNKWQCQGCKTRNPSEAGVSATSGSLSSGVTDTELGEVVPGTSDRGSCDDNINLASEIKLIRDQLTTIAREIISFREVISKISSNVDELNNRVGDIEKRVIHLEQRAADSQPQTTDSKLEDTLTELKSGSRFITQ
ncbi:unnamed protein product [Parnassius apollo]|uniref:(apollo) hypothetical protein n=1 Tax=Parnassius apollo TaxID=110799 RepID=A0A8S3WYU6_PARAO|nr:unnamed protein product [Parnassius apollo]